MKLNKLSVFALGVLALWSCKEDDDINFIDLLDVPQNTAEEARLDTENVEAGLIIEGATLETGTLTPSGDISFELDDTSYTGLQQLGFGMELTVPDNYAGTYLQLVEEDGTMSDNYFNIPVVSYDFEMSPKTQTKNKKKSHTSIFEAHAKTKRVGQDEENVAYIDVSFAETISEGTFCYVLCIYDTEGNISAPTEVCVEIEAFGGNDALVGSWNFVKNEEYRDDVYEETFTAGVDDCEEASLTAEQLCDSEASLKDEECYSESGVFTINADGTFVFEYQSTDDSYEYNYNMDIEASCYYYVEEVEEGKLYGNWSYNEEEKAFFLVATSREVILHTQNGEPYEDDYDDLDFPELIVTGEIDTLTSTELIFTDEYEDGDYDYETDTLTDYTVKHVIHFSK